MLCDNSRNSHLALSILGTREQITLIYRTKRAQFISADLRYWIETVTSHGNFVCVCECATLDLLLSFFLRYVFNKAVIYGFGLLWWNIKNTDVNMESGGNFLNKIIYVDRNFKKPLLADILSDSKDPGVQKLTIKSLV
jgi:hypothetical protein